MNARQLFDHLTSQGVRFATRGDALRLDAPTGVVTREHYVLLERHKAELLDWTRRHEEHAADLPDDRLPSFDQVLDMPLSELATAGLILKIDSAVVGEDVLLVSDNVPDERIEPSGRVVYRVRECEHLHALQPTPSHLALIHAVKEAFGGSIVEVKDQPSDDESA